MNKWLSPVSVKMLEFLYSAKDKVKITEIQKNIGSSYTTIYRFVDLLMQNGLISEKRESNVDSRGRIVVGETRWIWLTPKGKKVAEKLMEIKKIMENK